MSAKDIQHYPKRCTGCGEKVLSTKQAGWYESTVEGSGSVDRSWHPACRLAGREVRVVVGGRGTAGA